MRLSKIKKPAVMTMRFAVLASVLVLLVGSIAPSTLRAGTILHTADPQVYLDLGAAAEFASVGKLSATASDGAFTCSGTLIARSWVLTAAHCLGNAVSLEFDVGGVQHAASRWLAHPQWNGQIDAGYDLGLVKLASPSAVTPARRYSGSDEGGKTGVSVGFGTTGTGVTGGVTFDGRKRAGENVIDAFLVSPGNSGGPHRILLSDFDNPADGAGVLFPENGNNFGSSVPLPHEYMVATGDSGGGMFIDGLLAGVHSFTWGRLDGNPNSDYDDVFGQTRVSQHNAWINQQLFPFGGRKQSRFGRKGNRRTWPPINQSALVANPVPEPSAACLLMLAGVGALVVRWRR